MNVLYVTIDPNGPAHADLPIYSTGTDAELLAQIAATTHRKTVRLCRCLDSKIVAEFDATGKRVL